MGEVNQPLGLMIGNESTKVIIRTNAQPSIQSL